jgi:hypothetical protein
MLDHRNLKNSSMDSRQNANRGHGQSGIDQCAAAFPLAESTYRAAQRYPRVVCHPRLTGPDFHEEGLRATSAEMKPNPFSRSVLPEEQVLDTIILFRSSMKREHMARTTTTALLLSGDS